MAATDLTIYRGEKKTFTFTATENGAAINLTGATIRFAVRNNYPVSSVTDDTDALITKSTADGITITNAAGGVFDVSLVKADTNSIDPNQYLYGVEYVAQGETDPRVLVQAKFIVQSDIVRAS